MQLSEHFSLEEFCHSDTAIARGIRNVMPDALIPAARGWCLHIGEPVRAHFGKPVRLNSGYRGLPLNAAVGSKSTSQHVKAEAGDIEIDGVPNAELADWIRTNLVFDQLILENYTPGVPNSGWVHASWSTRIPRKSILTMMMGSHGPVYVTGLAA
jgi:hypothetical protein